VVSAAGRWVDGVNAEVVPFVSNAYACLPPAHQPKHAPSEHEVALLQSYPVPQPQHFAITSAVTERQLNALNYKERMHQLLFIEELAR
jgi:hypothetical protein